MQEVNRIDICKQCQQNIAVEWLAFEESAQSFLPSLRQQSPNNGAYQAKVDALAQSFPARAALLQSKYPEFKQQVDDFVARMESGAEITPAMVQAISGFRNVQIDGMDSYLRTEAKKFAGNDETEEDRQIANLLYEVPHALMRPLNKIAKHSERIIDQARILGRLPSSTETRI